MAKSDTCVDQTGPTGRRRFLRDASGRPGGGLEGPSLHPAPGVGALSGVEGSPSVLGLGGAPEPRGAGPCEDSLSVALTLTTKCVSPGRCHVAPTARRLSDGLGRTGTPRICTWGPFLKRQRAGAGISDGPGGW